MGPDRWDGIFLLMCAVLCISAPIPSGLLLWELLKDRSFILAKILGWISLIIVAFLAMICISLLIHDLTLLIMGKSIQGIK